MKITHVTRRYHPLIGGVETFVKQLAECQVDAGHEVAIITLVGPGLLARESVRGVNVKRIRGFGVRSYRFVPGLLRAVRDADVVHVHNIDYLAEYLGLTRWIHQKPLVVTTHGGFFHGQSHPYLRLFRQRVVSALTLRAYEYVLCTSAVDCDRFGIHGKRSERFPNAIHLPPTETSQEVVEGTVLYIGRLQAHKQVDLLLAALALVKSKYSINPLKCEVIGPEWGEGPRLRKLIRKYQLQDTVTLRGQLDGPSVECHRRGAALVVSPSGFESFGIAVLENLAHGKMVLANDIPAHRELIADGQNGYVVDFRDTESAASAIAKLLAFGPVDRERIARIARNSAEPYAWSRALPALDKIYEVSMSHG